jgi:hypothetical protein
MLDPANRGQAFWWGTSGERVWDENRLGWFVLQLMRERGIVLWGEDLRQEIPPPRREDLLADLQSACKSGLEHGRGGSAKSADWLLTAARCLYWLRRGELSSKSAAADWAYAHAEGEWRELLPQAKELRADPSMTGDVMQWLDGLTPAIREAWREVQRALDDAAARTGRPPD